MLVTLHVGQMVSSGLSGHLLTRITAECMRSAAVKSLAMRDYPILGICNVNAEERM